MASNFMAGILPEARRALTAGLQIGSAPAAALTAAAIPATRRRGRTLATHFLAQPLAILGRHLLPALAPFLMQAVAFVRRHRPPLLAHLLAHLAPLVGRHLRMRHRGDCRKDSRRQEHRHEVSPRGHYREFPLLHTIILALPRPGATVLRFGFCNRVFPRSTRKKLVTIGRMPTAATALSFAP